MKDLKDPENWKYPSPDTPGFHRVITPENSACTVTWVSRLNLYKGDSYTLRTGELEYNGVIIEGAARILFEGQSEDLRQKDSFYLPGDAEIEIKALEDLIMFFGAGPFEGKGSFFMRRFDPELPIGQIRQVHGQPPFERDVFMTLAQEDEGSRLICGITEGHRGQWTSWPPHQHSKDLEEVYCYFNLPAPEFALHLASRKAGRVEAVHVVSTGDFVLIPEGYHPTVGMPGVRSCYFWVMSALKPESRRYDLAVNDPNFDHEP